MKFTDEGLHQQAIAAAKSKFIEDDRGQGCQAVN